MAKKKQQGGTREGAGRPKVKDKAVLVGYYVRQSELKKVGKERAREISIQAFYKELKKISKWKR
jgi:hypothetical protein